MVTKSEVKAALKKAKAVEKHHIISDRELADQQKELVEEVKLLNAMTTDRMVKAKSVLRKKSSRKPRSLVKKKVKAGQ
ncbi:hypothetical protein J4460_06380 [Candidatus Woesearchaeota archaeon]|nr:MAG: hypothetical protein QS99_C0010G0037 [archaeon GW2011_AR4]MBS3130270.1 hypothetical protein [Candidatus Woesearchaeota archaeon]HIH38201.1 hypothetical protein [Candidatus Woesearchaeota archaeon]HIH49496.1 hypothetical protein [Candidatus Woesearchaeota archaeon]HIJ03878.1 hypothetical protein [Candidatus Woesearchaeota archaeon]